ncbi:putative pentatricopeptide repeat-containing protein At5g47460 [Silene latifolia]|uniref:putative pentatricopeptide repeat-containing protein At5g47460 n=1 Tax=Silene latifolia TaxID=37657 RepID=UPI003D7894B9
MQFHRGLFLPLSRRTFRISPNSAPKFHTNVPSTSIWDNKPDGLTLVQTLRACINNGDVLLGEQLHCYILRSGFASDVHVGTALVSFYAKVVCIDDAQKLFDEIPQLNVVSWNALISGYVRSGNLRKALSIFTELTRSELRGDAYSFTSALAVCGQLRLLRLGMSIHSKVITTTLESSVVMANCLIDMYGKCSSVECSIRVFDRMLDKDVISWNSVISACTRNRRRDLAFDYFNQMPCPETVTYNELITGVSRFGHIEDAIKILRSMPKPSSSSWNAILSAYVVRNSQEEALNFFVEMHGKRVIMDEFTFGSILSGIASISASRWGMIVHCCTIKCGLVASTFIGSALVDMYSKCGQSRDAETLFHSLPQKNIITWNALISGLAHNGESAKVVHYFEELKKAKGLKPDEITFMNVLASCSHNQLPLNKAYEYLKSMINDHGIKPLPQHLTSMIRLMGYHGELGKAKTMIDKLGLGSYASVWRALLGACATYGDLELAKVAAAKLSQLESHDDFGYVALSNINKLREKWMDATAMWDLMKDKGVSKGAGFSWVEGRKPLQ